MVIMVSSAACSLVSLNGMVTIVCKQNVLHPRKLSHRLNCSRCHRRCHCYNPTKSFRHCRCHSFSPPSTPCHRCSHRRRHCRNPDHLDIAVVIHFIHFHHFVIADVIILRVFLDICHLKRSAVGVRGPFRLHRCRLMLLSSPL